MSMSSVAATFKSTLLLDPVLEAFELLNAGFLICDAAGQLLFANDYGRRILESCDGLSLDEDGRVVTSTTGDVQGQGESVDFRATLAAAHTRYTHNPES